LDPIFLSGEANMFEVLKILDEKEARFKELENRSMKYNQWQEVLQTNPTVFEELDSLREDLSLRCVMWRSLKEWEELQEIWIKTQFNNIQAKEISQKADYYAKICMRLEKNLEDNPIQRKLKELVDTFKGAMPIVVALRNDALQEHHWKEIKDLINSDFDISNPEFTLQSLIDLNAVQFQEDITAISTQASQEASLRSQLQQLEEIWKKVEFTVTTHTRGDALIITEVDILFQALDEGLATINMVLGSRYVKPLRTEAEKWKKDLMTLTQIVEEWVTCQKQWMYLENIFSAADIKRQLPAESHQFEQVDKFFKGIMGRIGKLPNALRFYKQNGAVLDQLKNNNDILDGIQKKLEDYLENKRSSFPRFYFLSNDELLEILAHSQELDIVQLHLKTCFDNLVKLDIQQEVDIVAMYSNEGERIPFSKPQKARGQVETWLDSIQNAMRETLYKLMKSGLNDYANSERKQWVLTHYGQVVATIA
jgi:dynein heavy chain, axonemal